MGDVLGDIEDIAHSDRDVANRVKVRMKQFLKGLEPLSADIRERKTKALVERLKNAQTLVHRRPSPPPQATYKVAFQTALDALSEGP